jgi:hypothetical protein
VAAVRDNSAVTECDAASPAASSKRRRAAAGFVVEGVETVAMTDEHYEQAVDALATLIVRWAADREQSSPRPGRANSG